MDGLSMFRITGGPHLTRKIIPLQREAVFRIRERRVVVAHILDRASAWHGEDDITRSGLRVVDNTVLAEEKLPLHSSLNYQARASRCTR